MLIARNIQDRTTNPKISECSNEVAARNWCKFTSKDFYGIFAFSEEGKEPSEFWKNGRKYKTARAADLSGLR